MIMNATDWNTALYEKMSDEQDKFRDWLKSQPRRKSCTTPMSTRSGRTS